MFLETTATKKIISLNKRVRLVAGGTSASKTISILLYLIARAQSDTRPTLTSIVSESYPHLKRGAMRDFLNIMQAHGYFVDSRWNKTEGTYVFETGSKLEFFSGDQPSKVRGPRRDRLFVNEANNLPRETWEQLLIRTRELAFADWNPTSDFYLYEDYVVDEDAMTTSSEDAQFIILTYKDNEALEPAIVKEIESRRMNKGWWKVYGEGKRGEVEGKIYKGWKIIDEVPHEARLVSRGLDFGYAHDPAVLTDIYFYNGGYIVDEQFYRIGMKNNDIANYINNLPEPQTLVTADAAEPKSIDELRMHGVGVIESIKGQGSRNRRIDYVQQQKISVTKRSTNVIKSYRNYMWKTDKEGNILPEPDHYLSDGMDSVGYGIESQRPRIAKPQTTSGNLRTLWR